MSNTISPQELRINNIVQHNGVYWYVTDIMSPAPLPDERFSDKWVIGLMNGGVINVAIEEIEPVELTEEILVKCKQAVNNITSSKKFFIPITDLRAEIHINYVDYGNDIRGYTIEVTNSNYPIITEATFLHQLQNLFYSLTGRELEIKL